MTLVSTFFAALVFGMGLAVSGMIDPAKVQGFLDVTGQWDPSLAFVMGGALGVTSIGYAWLKSHGTGLDGIALQWPTRKDIDLKLVAGSALFGAGWGLAGYCPGPAIGSLAFGRMEVIIFVTIMLSALLITFRCMARR